MFSITFSILILDIQVSIEWITEFSLFFSSWMQHNSARFYSCHRRKVSTQMLPLRWQRSRRGTFFRLQRLGISSGHPNVKRRFECESFFRSSWINHQCQSRRHQGWHRREQAWASEGDQFWIDCNERRCRKRRSKQRRNWSTWNDIADSTVEEVEKTWPAFKQLKWEVGSIESSR